ncbi:hypothetical protein M9Y10_039032 [Tritrichomonas musculus]|uniref:Myb-like DNA-binding domain containing protein n=1 Tax=Tritrichomonas musculus TaxID=1915356 RepID=A0ABR2KAU7_9EUKA
MSQRKRSKINSAAKKQRMPFTAEEDQNIIFCVSYIGTKNWPLVSTFVKGRTPKQCRDRYMNYLKPEFSYVEWTQEEDNYLLELYEKIGPKWGVINRHLKNRNQISLKNRFMFLKKADDKNNNNVIQNNIITNSSNVQETLQEKTDDVNLSADNKNLSEHSDSIQSNLDNDNQNTKTDDETNDDDDLVFDFDKFFDFSDTSSTPFYGFNYKYNYVL